jgi:predicted phosphodiesterase
MDSSIRRIAAISDVHGNIWALEAVLRDITERGVDVIMNLGDHLYGPLDPIKTAALLQATPMVSIHGNCDRLLYAEGATSVTMQRNRSELTQPIRDWLRSLPATRFCTPEIFLCHGTPQHDDVYMLECVHQRGTVGRRAPEWIAQECEGIYASLILCGHSHQSGELLLVDNRMVVNPGSVGLPAYTHETPLPHAMRSGSPHARYALIERNKTHWRVERIEVKYDWDSAAATAARNGREDWAEWLRTGEART